MNLILERAIWAEDDIFESIIVFPKIISEVIVLLGIFADESYVNYVTYPLESVAKIRLAVSYIILLSAIVLSDIIDPEIELELNRLVYILESW